MLDLGRIDVEEIAEALADQTDYEHLWLIDPRTGGVLDQRHRNRWAEPCRDRRARSGSDRPLHAYVWSRIYEHHPALISPWHAWRDVRAQRGALEWLLDQGLIGDRAARQFADEHPDPDLP